MKKDMLNSLKHSLEQERKASKNKTKFKYAFFEM